MLFAAAVSAPSKADGASDAQQLACYQRAFNQPQGQREANICADDAYNRAEKALQSQWTQLLDVIKGRVQQRKQLNSSQQTSLAYRTAWCRAAAWDKRGQSDWAQMHFGCLAELTRQRTKELGDLLLGEGY
jgi:uncharacterized protein YecT (DUF1311 family)